ncbi:hypothetical protein EYF80_047834 [Liparis tanakae]|uniref:Uncharacterized protein n=1 Tax=Liparis tanakae TaxID=230148 RepID=A0A4Z2FMA9_9TELE|nr:hypothetical protein EYF80_047834 [Liparis tanakae]
MYVRTSKANKALVLTATPPWIKAPEVRGQAAGGPVGATRRRSGNNGCQNKCNPPPQFPAPLATAGRYFHVFVAAIGKGQLYADNEVTRSTRT